VGFVVIHLAFAATDSARRRDDDGCKHRAYLLWRTARAGFRSEFMSRARRAYICGWLTLEFRTAFVVLGTISVAMIFAISRNTAGMSIRLGLVRRHPEGQTVATHFKPAVVPRTERSRTMRVMVLVKATKTSEAGILPGDPRAPAGFDKLFEQMGKFNEELVKAGVMLAADGLHPSSKGKRVRFTGSGGKRTVVDGPFTETKELVAGYWIWQVKSIEEAVEWVRRCPDPMPGEESEIEIRPIYEFEDCQRGTDQGE
jgi:hypothetical protein